MICNIPFSELFLKVNGEITPCCYLDDYVLGHISEISLDEAFNSKKMDDLRSEFISSEIKTCSSLISNIFCAKQTSKGVTKELKSIWMAPSGSCNQKCAYCNVWEVREHHYNNENFYSQLEGLCKNGIEMFYFVGGEPLLLKETFKIVEILTQYSIPFEVVTNLNYKLDEKRLDFFKNKGLSKVAVSLDCLDEQVLERTRQGIKLGLVLENLNRIRRDNLEIEINFTVNKYNLEKIDELIKFIKENNFTYKPVFLSAPREFSLYSVENRLEVSRTIIDLIKESGFLSLFTCLNPIFLTLLPEEKVQVVEDYLKIRKSFLKDNGLT